MTYLFLFPWFPFFSCDHGTSLKIKYRYIKKKPKQKLQLVKSKYKNYVAYNERSKTTVAKQAVVFSLMLN